MTIQRDGRALQTWVGSFDSMKRRLYQLMDAGLVVCSACDQPAKRIDFQDAAEWYPHCLDHHYGFGEQWTGSTRFITHYLWVAVFPEKVQPWLDGLSPEERKRWHLQSYDTRNLYDLIEDGDWGQTRLTYARTDTSEVYVSLRTLTNGEYAYEIHECWGSGMVHHGHSHGLVGTFVTPEEAYGYALNDPNMPDWARKAATA